MNFNFIDFIDKNPNCLIVSWIICMIIMSLLIREINNNESNSLSQ
jgi:hypothetical protein